MTLAKFNTHLDRYLADLEGILSRFVHTRDSISITENDQANLHQLILEIGGLFHDNAPSTKYAKTLVDAYNLGLQNFLESSSYDFVKQCISILRAAKTRVQNNPELLSNLNDRTTSAESGHLELQPPEKVTLNWLYTHVPYTFWIWLGGIFLAGFAAGVTLGRLPLIQQLLSLYFK